ncbi:hypothetical protein DAETH_33590 (plasmid) [Deinococcus aetherius]|uniref:Uncharacterized protein n=1 Tax=Deinococcus aetherius TaxID=200252 RepID=A0ABM8AHV9_9DEIO|nr:right-handed parallel beta-helix repeat-containing protein [Deinococcus aetherius]BDP43390.1 hypothetical protein DAETH_33590 [Deinococcus aetherius]
MNQTQVASRSSFALLVTAALLVGCGVSRPGGTSGGEEVAQQLEAERAGTVSLSANEVQALTVVDSGVPNGGKVISDAAASGGQAVKLLSNGNAVRFTVPAGSAAGNYTVRVRGRGDLWGNLYRESPIVTLRVNGAEKGRVELSSATYAVFTVGTFALKPGDTLDVTFINDAYDGANDRNAVIDYLIIDPAGTTSAPTSPSTPTPAPGTVSGNAVDVRSFGAKGDGVTDDTAALNRAAAGAAGKDILFPAGTYLVSGPVVFANLNGRTVSGAGATIKAAPSWVQRGRDIGILTFRNARDVTIRGFTLQGFANRNISAFAYRMDGLIVEYSQNVTVEGTEVREVQSVGINGEHSQGFKVLDSRSLRAHGHGMGCEDCRNSVFRGNTIVGDADPNASVSNQNTGIGLMLQLGDTVLIENNTIKNQWDTATKTEGTNNVTYRGNTVDVFGKDGIKIQSFPSGGVNRVYGGVIENNRVSGGRRWRKDGGGLALLQGVVGGRISGNKLYGLGNPNVPDTGIVLNTFGSPTRDVVVEDNEVKNAYVGLMLAAENGTVVRHNTFTSDARSMKTCIEIPGSPNSLIEGNTFSGFREICTVVYGGRDTTIGRNTYRDGDTGVFVNGSTQPGYRILNNTFDSTVSRPINIQGSPTCSGNTGAVPKVCQ